jgi:hypothetical protein
MRKDKVGCDNKNACDLTQEGNIYYHVVILLTVLQAVLSFPRNFLALIFHFSPIWALKACLIQMNDGFKDSNGSPYSCEMKQNNNPSKLVEDFWLISHLEIFLPHLLFFYKLYFNYILKGIKFKLLFKIDYCHILEHAFLFLTLLIPIFITALYFSSLFNGTVVVGLFNFCCLDLCQSDTNSLQ